MHFSQLSEIKGAVSTSRCQVVSVEPGLNQTTQAKLTIFIVTPTGEKLVFFQYPDDCMH